MYICISQYSSTMYIGMALVLDDHFQFVVYGTSNKYVLKRFLKIGILYAQERS